MLYIVEVPHQRPASCWTAENAAEVISMAAHEALRSGGEVNSFDQAIDWIAADLHSCAVFVGLAEVVGALDTHPIFRGHQGARAEAALRAKLIQKGVLAQPVADEE